MKKEGKFTAPFSNMEVPVYVFLSQEIVAEHRASDDFQLRAVFVVELYGGCFHGAAFGIAEVIMDVACDVSPKMGTHPIREVQADFFVLQDVAGDDRVGVAADAEFREVAAGCVFSEELAHLCCLGSVADDVDDPIVFYDPLHRFSFDVYWPDALCCAFFMSGNFVWRCFIGDFAGFSTGEVDELSGCGAVPSVGLGDAMSQIKR